MNLSLFGAYDPKYVICITMMLRGTGGEETMKESGRLKTIGTVRTHLVLIIANDLIVGTGCLQARDVGVFCTFSDF